MSSHAVGRARSRALCRSVALAGSCLAALASSTALAQDEAEVQEQQAAASPLEIIVTAERRATNLQDTPLSVLAITNEAIEAKALRKLKHPSRSRKMRSFLDQ